MILVIRAFGGLGGNMKLGIVLLVIASLTMGLNGIVAIFYGFLIEPPNWGAVLVITFCYSIIIIPCLIIGVVRLKKHFKLKGVKNEF